MLFLEIWTTLTIYDDASDDDEDDDSNDDAHTAASSAQHSNEDGDDIRQLHPHSAAA